jgi:uncharacterized protein YdeI (BOF family)
MRVPSPEGFVTKRFKSLSFIAIATVFAMISWSSLVQAQQTGSQGSSTPQTQQPQSQQPPDTQAPEPQQPTQAQPRQPNQQQNDQAQPSDSSGSEFIGTVVKQGDKYMFQDAASGQMYDIDHQEQVKKFEGKKVRVHGTLDPSTKTIHVQ